MKKKNVVQKRVEKKLFVTWRENGCMKEKEFNNSLKAKKFKKELHRKGVQRVKIETRHTRITR